MISTIAIGAKHSADIEVDLTLTVPNVSKKLRPFEDMPPVFATAFMVAFVEATCIEALDSYLGDGEHSVGTKINISHLAATPVGMKVTAEVKIVAIDGRTVLFNVIAKDGAGLIGQGTHERSIIHMERFMSRVVLKKALHG